MSSTVEPVYDGHTFDSESGQQPRFDWSVKSVSLTTFIEITAMNNILYFNRAKFRYAIALP